MDVKRENTSCGNLEDHRNLMYTISNFALLDELYPCAIKDEADEEKYNFFIIIITNK